MFFLSLIFFLLPFSQLKSGSYSDRNERADAKDLLPEAAGRVITSEGAYLDNVVIYREGAILAVTDDRGLYTLQGLDSNELLKFYRYGYESLVLTFRELSELEVVVMQREAVPVEGLSVSHRRETVSGQSEMKILIPVTAELKGRELYEILRDYPEITVSGLQLKGERQTVSILGHHTRHTIILLDGIPLNRGGQPFDISTIPTGIIESIEIIKGGGSSFKGAGAIGGLININTRYPHSRYEMSLGQEFGSFGAQKTSVSLYHRFTTPKRYWLGDAGLSLYAERGRAKNNFSYQDSQGEEKIRDYNDKFSQNLHLRLQGSLGITSGIVPEVTYKLELLEFDNKLPGPTNYEILYRDARLEGVSVNNYLAVKLPAKNFISELTAYHHDNRVVYDNTRAPHQMFYAKNEQKDTKSGLHFKLSPLRTNRRAVSASLWEQIVNPITDIGLEYNREDFSYLDDLFEAKVIPAVKQENYAFAVRSNFLFPVSVFDWNNDLSGRFEYYSRRAKDPEKEQDKAWKPYLSWRYSSAFIFYYPLYLTLGGGVSRNYSLPSFYDLYWKGDSQTTGNPELETEKSLSINLFSEVNLFNLNSRIEYHHSRITDLIYWYRSITGWKPGNVASAEIRNLQISVEYYLPGFLTLTASWLKTEALNKSRENDNTPGYLYNKKLLYIPEESFNLQLHLRYSSLFFRVSHSYTGIQWSTPDQLIGSLSSYHLTDTEIGVSFPGLSLNWQFSLLLNNIFAARYEIYSYTPQPGFNWLLNLKVSYQR
jgi:outer membrane cobalamin receptor